MRPVVDMLEKAGFAQALDTRVFHRWQGDGVNPFAGVLDWDSHMAALLQDGFPAGTLRVMHKRDVLHRPLYSSGGKLRIPNLQKLMGMDVSLAVLMLEDWIPAMAQLRSDIRAVFGKGISVGSVATSGPGGANKLHCDASDLLVVQLCGHKRWTVYAPEPGLSDVGIAACEPKQAPIFDDFIAPGDILFVPTGYAHWCENGPELSLHLSVSFKPN